MADIIAFPIRKQKPQKPQDERSQIIMDFGAKLAAHFAGLCFEKGYLDVPVVQITRFMAETMISDDFPYENHSHVFDLLLSEKANRERIERAFWKFMITYNSK
jgi:hypothetical protein